jgi:hypothetical protein
MKHALMLVAMLASTAAFAQANVTSGTASTAQQQSTIQNTVNLPGGPSSVSETIRSAPTVYAPNPITPFSQASCVYTPTAAVSFVGFGIGGAAPIDGQTCNWRLSTQGVEATAAGLRDLAIAGFKNLPTTTKVEPMDGQSIIEMLKAEDAVADAPKLLQKAAALMDAATDMQCLDSDRQRAVMERLGFCQNVRDLATLDHRWNQPRNYQVDYSGDAPK